MKTVRKTLLTLAIATTGLGLGGCAPDFGTVEFDPVSTPPRTVTVRSHLIELPAGMAVVVKAKPISDNANEYDSSYKIDFFSQDRDVFRVFRRESRREFVFVGVAPGNTCVEVEIDGRAEDCIDVTVEPPEG